MTINWRSPRTWGIYGLAIIVMSLIPILGMIPVGVVLDWLGFEGFVGELACFFIPLPLMLFLVGLLQRVLKIETIDFDFLKEFTWDSVFACLWLGLVWIVVVNVLQEASTIIGNEIIMPAAAVVIIPTVLGAELLLSFLKDMSAKNRPE